MSTCGIAPLMMPVERSMAICAHLVHHSQAKKEYSDGILEAQRYTNWRLVLTSHIHVSTLPSIFKHQDTRLQTSHSAIGAVKKKVHIKQNMQQSHQTRR